MKKVAAIVFAGALLCAGSALANGHGSGKGKGEHSESGEHREKGSAARQAAAPAGAAQALFETKCSDCHELSRPLGKNKDREGWTATVTRMQGKKPGWISDAEAEEIIGYLVRERGPAAGR